MSPALPVLSSVEGIRVEGKGAHHARREEGADPLADMQPTWWGEAR